ncbi:MAG TPA: energy transducer TonB [Burkholderiaceae bacterium]
MDFAHEQQFTVKKAGGIGMVVLAHALLVGGLVYGLHTTFKTTEVEPPVIVLPPLPKAQPTASPLPEGPTIKSPPDTITQPVLPHIEVGPLPPVSNPVDGPAPGPAGPQGGPTIVDGGGNGLVPPHALPSSPARVDFDSCKPAYPRSSVLNEEEGVVRLRMEIGADGHLVSSAIVKSSGHSALDNAALNGLGKCAFQAAVKDGTPVRSTFVTDYVWSLER